MNDDTGSVIALCKEVKRLTQLRTEAAGELTYLKVQRSLMHVTTSTDRIAAVCKKILEVQVAITNYDSELALLDQQWSSHMEYART